MLGWILQKKILYKDPSFETTSLMRKAKEMGITLKHIDPKSIEIVVTSEDRKSVLVDNVQTKIPDFILPRMGATTNYFALAVIRHLERLGVYCVNPSQSIETVKDKLFQMQILAESGFPIPKTILAKFPVNTEWVDKQLGYPVVVKALSGTQGSGVYLCNDKVGLEDFTKMIEIANREANLILQEYISKSRGRDLRVFVLGDQVLGAMERFSNDDSFKANFSRGGGVRTYPINDNIKKMSIEIAKLFNLDIAGIDLLFNGDEFKICEVNSSPGFKGFTAATGIDVPTEILTYIQKKIDKK